MQFGKESKDYFFFFLGRPPLFTSRILSTTSSEYKFVLPALMAGLIPAVSSRILTASGVMPKISAISLWVSPFTLILSVIIAGSLIISIRYSKKLLTNILRYGKMLFMEHSYKFIDLSGQRFGRLTVIRYDHTEIAGKRREKIHCFLCKCDCGNEKVVRGHSLKTGNTTSCGCQQRLIASKTMTDYNKDVEHHTFYRTHNHTNTRLYHTYSSMKERCYNPNVKSYIRYGGRGIKMCDEWLNDPAAFFEWAEKSGYKENLTIDRIDNNGNYEPSNCRWATYKEQGNNKCNNHNETMNGVTKTVAEWADLYGINKNIIYGRLKKGLDIFSALTKPVRKSPKRKKGMVV